MFTTVTRKHVQVLDKHMPELSEVAEVKNRGWKVDLLARCKCRFVLYHFYTRWFTHVYTCMCLRFFAQDCVTEPPCVFGDAGHL